jgi:hypothetical protein
MSYPRIDSRRVKVNPLATRKNKHHIDDVRIDPDADLPPVTSRQERSIAMVATRIRAARTKQAAVMLAYGAHMVKNGLGLVVVRMMEEGWITHLATNGAGVIHDWEYAFQGQSEEDVRAHVARGQFGTWDETGRHTHLAVLTGVLDGMGYGESVGRMICEDGYTIPDRTVLQQALAGWVDHPADDERMPARADLLQVLVRHGIEAGRHKVAHPYRAFSLTGHACRLRVPLTVHPGIGYDIIYTHPLANSAAIGRGAGIDFSIFVNSVSHLDDGVLLSVGSSIMAPQVFEKSMSIANNLRIQEGMKPLQPFIAVNDLMEDDWDWNAGEPPMDNPAYYNRIGKSFSRMGGEVLYTAADNRVFMQHLCRQLSEG